MNEITCQNIYMDSYPKKGREKRNEFLGIKVGESEKETLAEIALEHDRPLGYVGRELMLRGLAQYRRDGLLKEPPTPIERLKESRDKASTITGPVLQGYRKKKSKRA
jgi:hypothetical protein